MKQLPQQPLLTTVAPPTATPPVSASGGGLLMTAPQGAAGRSSGAGGQWTEKQEFRTVHIQLPPHMLKQAGQGTVQVGPDLQHASKVNISLLFQGCGSVFI